jgi:hypothetical protein
LPHENLRPNTRLATHSQIGTFDGGFFKRSLPAIKREPEVKLFIGKIKLKNGPQPGGGAWIQIARQANELRCVRGVVSSSTVVTAPPFSEGGRCGFSMARK